MSTDNIRMLRGVEASVSNQNPGKRQLKADPLEDGAPETAKLSRFRSAIRAIKEAALPVLVAGAIALSSACSDKATPYMSQWDGGPDASTDTDTDSDTDTDTDTDSDTDTETETETGTDTDTDTDTDSDTDTDTDTDTGPEEPPFISMQESGIPMLSVAKSLTGACTISAADLLMISADHENFEIEDLMPLGDFEPGSRLGDTLYYVPPTDSQLASSVCALPSPLGAGMDVSNGILILYASDGVFYAYELANTPEGYVQLRFEYGGQLKLLQIYDAEGGYATPTGKDEVWIIGGGHDDGYTILDEAVGIALTWGGSITMHPAKLPLEAGTGALYRIEDELVLFGAGVNGAILEISPPSGFTIGSFTSNTVIAAPITTPGGIVLTDTSSSLLRAQITDP